MSKEPKVSVVTPVYNGGPYIRECIESVLAQTYSDWEYVIVNNCSTDETLEIVKAYEARDKRIRVLKNERFVGVIENHNIAFRNISGSSVYCKVVSADDWLFPKCLESLVAVAESDPRIAIVGSNALSESGVLALVLPPDTTVFEGAEIARLYLLGKTASFGTPSTVLYQSACIRKFDPFFPGVEPSGDLAACLRAMEHSRFGFVRDPLSFERKHNQAVGSRMLQLNSFLVDRIEFLHDYGKIFLNESEYTARREELEFYLYRFLAQSVLRKQVEGFWQYHKRRLSRLGYGFYDRRMILPLLKELRDAAQHPAESVRKVIRRARTSRAVEVA